ncbi:MAG: hypothetical protein B7Z68_07545 [Acidobacteria bacterium 21-70-11]|nr:MAG: hypothetical protein B7Z68_07545 [Acidobacteria bacterium 21-70-11]
MTNETEEPTVESIERRKVTWQSEIARLDHTWQTEISRLEKSAEAHYSMDEKMHHETNIHMATMIEKLGTIEEVVLAWNNIKGFTTVMHSIAGVLKWAVGIGAAIGTIWWSIKGGGLK